MKRSELAMWLKATRKRLGLAQSDVSAYLTFKLRRSVNQARIVDHEKDRRLLSKAIIQILEAFFRQVEELRRMGRHWTEAR